MVTKRDTQRANREKWNDKSLGEQSGVTTVKWTIKRRKTEATWRKRPTNKDVIDSVWPPIDIKQEKLLSCIFIVHLEMLSHNYMNIFMLLTHLLH